MAFIPNTILLLLFLILLGGAVVYLARKGVSGLKLMLLGIHITIFGGIIAVDPNSNLAGVEYLIALSGFLISIKGFGKED